VSDRASAPAGYEAELERLNRETVTLTKGMQAAIAVARKAQGASAKGNQSELTASIAAVRDQLADLYQRASELVARADFDIRSWMESGEYARELIELAEASNLRVIESDGKLLCYPSVLQLMPAEQAIMIDRKRVRTLRPSEVVRALQSNSQARLASGRRRFSRFWHPPTIFVRVNTSSQSVMFSATVHTYSMSQPPLNGHLDLQAGGQVNCTRTDTKIARARAQVSKRWNIT